MAAHQGPGEKVVVFGYEHESIGLREVPDALVIVASEAEIANVVTVRKAGKGPRGAEKTGSDRAEPSRDRSEKSTFALRCEGQTGSDVLARQFGKVSKNLSLRHARGEVFQNIRNGESKPANTRLAASLAGLNSDPIQEI